LFRLALLWMLVWLSACAPVLSNMPPVPMTAGRRAAIGVGVSGGLAPETSARPLTRPTGSMDGGVSVALSNRKHLELGFGGAVLGGDYWGQRSYYGNGWMRGWVVHERAVDFGFHVEGGILATHLGERLLPLPTFAFGTDLSLQLVKGLQLYSSPTVFPVGARLPVGLALRAGPLAASAEVGYLARVSVGTEDIGWFSVPYAYDASAPYIGARLFLIDKLARRRR
jgi:hypothetical protein